MFCVCIYGFNVKSLDYGDWWLNVWSVARFVSNGIRECWKGRNVLEMELGFSRISDTVMVVDF